MRKIFSFFSQVTCSMLRVYSQINNNSYPASNELSSHSNHLLTETSGYIPRAQSQCKHRLVLTPVIPLVCFSILAFKGNQVSYIFLLLQCLVDDAFLFIIYRFFSWRQRGSKFILTSDCTLMQRFNILFALKVLNSRDRCFLTLGSLDVR